MAWLQIRRPAPAGRRPVLVHVPHAGLVVPDDVGIVAPASRVAHDQARSADHATDRLWRPAVDAGATMLATRISRLVCDMERFADDRLEAHNAAHGRGVVYTRTACGRPLRAEPLDPALRARLLARYHAPWHALLADEADAVIGDHGQCWIIDAHSFPSVPLGCEPAPHAPRPDICLGFDHVFTPGWCRAPLVDLWCAAGFTVAVNTPFAGALVPSRHWSEGDTRVRSVMVEVHRRCYLRDDEQTYDARHAARVQAVMTPMLDLLAAGGRQS